MNFLYPQYLYGLLAISIPIIIHLFNFRRYKKIYFSNVRFIEEIKQKTKRKSNLKHLLVLISRMLAIAAIVLAFAQPYIPVDDRVVHKGKNVVGVYVDNSFSMGAESVNGILIEAAKNFGREILKAYQATDDFLYTTNDFEGKHQRLVSKEDADEFIIDTEVTPVVRKLSEVLKQQEQLMLQSEAEQRSVYLISDFQKLICDFESIDIDSSFRVFLIPMIGIKESNIYVDSCWLDEPILMKGQLAKLNAKIVNDSEFAAEQLAINLFLDNEPSAIGNVDIAPNSSANVQLSFMPNRFGDYSGRVEIMDYPIAYDNSFYISFKINEKISIAVINGAEENKYLNSLFSSDSLFNYKNINIGNVDFAALKNEHLIVLNQIEAMSSGLKDEMYKNIERGASIFIIPSIKADMSSYSSFLMNLGLPKLTKLDTSSTEVNRINYEHDLFKGVFEEMPKNINLPWVSSYIMSQKPTKSSFQYLLGLLNGDNLLVANEYKRGKVYLLSAPLDASYSNFPEHSIFVPIMYKVAFLSKVQDDLFYELDKRNYITILDSRADGESVFKLTQDSGFELIPALRKIDFNTQLFFGDDLREDGNYKLVYEDEIIRNVAFNYSREESKLEYFNQDELKEGFSLKNNLDIDFIKDLETPISKTIQKMDNGMPLWKWFVLLTLLFLAIEVALLRLF